MNRIVRSLSFCIAVCCVLTGIADALHPCSPDAVRLAGTAEASGAAWEAKREALKNKARPLILNSDGNDMIFYPSNAPITVAAFREQRLNSYRNTRISALSYCPQSSPFGCMTARKAGWLFDSRPCEDCGLPRLRQRHWY